MLKSIKHHCRKYHCCYCLQIFICKGELDNQMIYCKNQEPQWVKMYIKGILQFTYFEYQIEACFVIYA